MLLIKHCSACQAVFSTESKVRRRCDSCKIVRAPRPAEQTRASWKRKYAKTIKKRHDFITARGTGCESCGYNTCVEALEFHHIDPSIKEFALGASAFTKHATEVFQEAEKCKLLCSNCHRQVHFLEDQKNKTHSSPEVKAVMTWRRNLKMKAIAYKGSQCQECKQVHEPYVFDFHHIDPNVKEFGIGNNGNIRSWERVKIELDKCILLCANCHREEHARLRCGSSVG